MDYEHAGIASVFISNPFEVCPKCGENTFGILMVCKDHYWRRCTNCLYPPGHDMSARYPLPTLDKKIIYLDQFAISNMMVATNASTRAHKRGSVSPFWSALLEKLDKLCRMQLIVCPDSDFHRQESLIAPFHNDLEDMYKHLSQGVGFYDHGTIQRFQILSQLKLWLGQAKNVTLDAQNVIHGEINAWQRTFMISVRDPGWSELIDEIRGNRERVDDALSAVFERWKGEGDKKFDYWYEEERSAFAKVLLGQFRRQADNLYLASRGLLSIPAGELLPCMAAVTFCQIKDRLRRHGIEEKAVGQTLLEFLESEEFREAPFIRIGAMLYAAMARQAASGRQRPPGKGFMTDVNMISVLLPYCDAMFIDNECRGFLTDRPLCDEIRYDTRTFSLSTKEEFMGYLDEIEASATEEHLQKVLEVYGPIV